MTPSEFKAARLKLIMTQAELAKILHVDKRTISRWEGGTKRGIPFAYAHIVNQMLE